MLVVSTGSFSLSCVVWTMRAFAFAFAFSACSGHSSRLKGASENRQVSSQKASTTEVGLSETHANFAQEAAFAYGVRPSSLAQLRYQAMEARSVKSVVLQALKMMLRSMHLLRPAALIMSVLLFNLHYVLFRRPFLEGLLTSRPVLALAYLLTGPLISQAMTKEGVPQPNRTEVYSFGTSRGLLDVFEPTDATAPPNASRPVVLYFHAGAWLYGHRSFGRGMCSWLASHGALCLSVSYRLTGSGCGISGCIEDAWAALRWTRANSARLNIDPSRIIVYGDSAGALLATALGTGLDPKSKDPVDLSELPSAVVAGWPVTAIGASTFCPTRADKNASWEPTPAGKDFRVANTFVPEKYRHSIEATQECLKCAIAGGLLGFGRCLFGLLPATRCYPSDDAASISPLSLANRQGLPPMLLLAAGDDMVVPCEQVIRFAVTARAAGNEVALLIFEGGGHGDGGHNCATGQDAILRFLRHQKLLTGRVSKELDPHDALGGAMRAFSLKPPKYKSLTFLPWVHGNKTTRIPPAS